LDNSGILDPVDVVREINLIFLGISPEPARPEVSTRVD
jgi:hypothetical protein